MFVFCFSLIKVSDQFFKKALLAADEQDDELCYESYFQYFTIIIHIQKQPEYKKDNTFYNLLMGPTKTKQAIVELERLDYELTKR